MRFLGFLFLVGVAGAVGGVVYVLAGFYSVAATEPHPALLEWLAHESFEASVARHAGSIEVPPLDGEARLAEGLEEYVEMCEICHAGPGVEPTAVARGLYPPAPELADEAEEWTSAELFWLIKHGAKDTGMPAFGPTHDDDELWSIVAFTRQLPTMSAEAYRAQRQEMGEGHSHGDDHDSDAGDDPSADAEASAGSSSGKGASEKGAEGHSHADGEGHSHE